MYMGRYNLSMVNPVLSQTYGWDKTQIGSIITPALLAYGIFAIFNGPIADKMGGRKSMLIGATGTVFFNILFGLGAYLGVIGKQSYLLGYLATVWMLNSYFQSFGALSLIKVNSAWFHVSERGVFSAIFGSMIQMGRTLIFLLGPLLIAVLPWQWVFFVPSVIIALMTVFTYLNVQNGPENCGYPVLDVQDASSSDEVHVSVKYLLKKIFTSPVTLSIAAAEFCTGFVRQGFEQWFPRYMVEVQKLPLSSPVFQRNALGVVLAGIAGAFAAGAMSDLLFKGRRLPVAFLGYFLQIFCLMLIFISPSLNWVGFAFVINSFAISMVQSMLSGTASMDFGGKKAAATAAGLFDGMQYVGGSFVGIGMGWMLDHFGWKVWAPSMIGFAVVGLIIMGIFWNARPNPGGYSRATRSG
jgi:OPA family glycerol-3-phosphate transporter-like MFS transporter